MPAAFFLAVSLALQTPVTPAPKMQGPDDPPISLTRSITLDGVVLPYTATFGLLPLKDEKGEVEARMSFTAYTKNGADAATRPLLLAYNGGPGSASLWLHLGTIGPRRVSLNDDGTMPRPPFRLVDNTDTWLKDADVVLIDAPSTGAGRVKPEAGKKFFGMRQDLDAFTRFIKLYLAKYNRWGSPIYLAGESYGGIRTAGLAKTLLDNGIAISGAIIVSGTMNFATLDGGPGNDLPYTGFFPTFAQTAWYHKKLSPAWQAKSVEEVAKAAEIFANGPYQQALFKGDALTDAEARPVIVKYAELTGLSPEYVKRSRLRVPEWHFFKELLRDRGQTVGRFDSRMIGVDQDDAADGPEYDASDAAVEAPFLTAMQELLTGEFGFQSDTPYRTWGDIGGWEYPRNGYADTSENLRQAMAQNPHFRVLFTCGRYDLACPYFATRYTVDHMGLRPEQAKRIEWAYYPAGHMIYIEKDSRAKLARDVSAFIKGTK